MTRINPFYFLSLLLLPLFFSCGSSRKTAKEFKKLPEWIKFKPQDNLTYYGVGKSVKSGFPDRYIKEAENNALADLAESISVTINTNSLFYQFDIDDQKSDFYMNKQKIQSSNYIEGYTVFKTYENDEYYWTLVEISKQKYEKIKLERKLTTLKKANEFYATALAKKQENDFYNAVSYFVKSLETLKPYWKEKTVYTKKNGETVDLAIENLNELQKLFNGIKIEKIKNSVTVKRGQYLNSNDAVAVLKHHQYGVMENFPFAITSPLSFGNAKNKFSKKNGILCLPPEKMNTVEKELIFELSIDSKILLKKFTTDLALRDILSVSIPKKQRLDIKVEIIQPSLFITINSKSLSIQKTKQKAMTFFEEEGILTAVSSNQNYRLKIDIIKKASNSFLINTLLIAPSKKQILQKARTVTMDPFVYDTQEKIEKSIFNSLKRKELLLVLEALE